MRALLWLFLLPILTSAQTLDWRTDYEKSNYLRTPRYDETMAYCRRLEKASPLVRIISFGTSPQGRPLPLVIVSKDSAFTPEAAHRTRRPIILIQSSIHAGEMDGKDASMMLIRDMVITKERTSLLDNAIVLFIPIFNVDGHERFGPYNRINQNGPEETGWRVTAQNLNLNRDYMKADAPEIQAWLKLFTTWLPDFFVDCHVTDGMDFQYDVTFAMETWPNADRELSQWYEREYIPVMLTDVEHAGHGIAPYVVPREENDLSRGLVYSASSPRLSTGYCAKQNRPALLIETHMLKPYKTRVESTYEILVSTIAFVNRKGNELHTLVTAIDDRTASMGTADPSVWLPLRFELTNQNRPIPFRGIGTRIEHSDVSGTDRVVWTGIPKDTVIPYFDHFRVADSVTVPIAYLIPREWTKVIEVLRVHGILMRTLSKDVSVEVESYQLGDPRWQERPFEGRHAVRFKAARKREQRTIPAGTVLVPMNQRTATVIVNLLEPTAPDALAGWGFFDAIFEQKEYGESCVLERLASDMMQKDTTLRVEFVAKLAADTAFARNAYARLNFFYQRSPYWDRSIGAYPVLRVVGEMSE